jgi:hypothetical protein
VPAPAAAPGATKVASALAARTATSRRTGDGGPGPGTGLVLLLLLVPVGVVVGLVVLLSTLGGATKEECSSAGGAPLPGDFSGPGSLGGVGGTGISPPLVQTVRRGSPHGVCDTGTVGFSAQRLARRLGPPTSAALDRPPR